MGKIYLTTSQIAAACNVTRFTVRNWINDGKLKANKTAGGHRRILESVLLEFARDNDIVLNFQKTSSPKPKVLTSKKKETSQKKTNKDGVWQDNQCLKCNQIKEKIRKYYFLLKEFDQMRQTCGCDCSSCQYLMNPHPEDGECSPEKRKHACNMISPEKKNLCSQSSGIRNNFFKSGKAVGASLHSLSSGTKRAKKTTAASYAWLKKVLFSDKLKTKN